MELDRALAVIIFPPFCLNFGQAAAGPAGLAPMPLVYDPTSEVLMALHVQVEFTVYTHKLYVPD